jgi:hypothetical protein
MIHDFNKAGTGLVSDLSIYRHLGEVIGRPLRGSTDAMEAEMNERKFLIPNNPCNYDIEPQIGQKLN